MFEGLLAVAVDLFESEDPLDAEIIGASMVSIDEFDDDGFTDALIEGFIPEFEAGASPATLALLLAIGSSTAGRAAPVARAAADRLVRAGVAAPTWAADLRAPVTVGECLRLDDSAGSASMLVGKFHRAGRGHVILVGIDHEDCGAADELLVFDVNRLPGALETIRATARAQGLEVSTEAMDPAEFRWEVEQALDARAVHDSAHLAGEMTGEDDESALGFHALAELARARLETLPTTGRPPAPHRGELSPLVPLTPLQLLAQQLAGFVAGQPGSGRAKTTPNRTAIASLPAQRRRSGQPAPAYQIKVSLRGSKPPIWRRLEVPADIGLDRLHTVIQVAFGWSNTHLHVFETDFGEFGVADAGLGHRSAAEVTLEQVAPAVKGKLRYTYDFGDGWVHDVVVEKVLDRGDATSLPRCTGGRRAAPPDDCGGILGYADLVEVLRDPADAEHEDTVEWLGLDDAGEFDPDRFDAGSVTRALAGVF